MKFPDYYMKIMAKNFLALFLFQVAVISGWSEDGGNVLLFGTATTSEKNLERSLEGLLLKVPKAVKLFEHRDEWRALCLVKLSDHSYGMMQASGSGGHTWSVVNAKTGADCLILDKPKITEGEFTYTYDDPCLGGPVQTTYTWGISEYDLEKDHGRHLIFTYKFSGAKGEPQNTVSIAIDWEAGLAEGVKIIPGK